ncbi:hypothetical protein D922_02417 [Enterococcus faecalis 06-MB-DW-09]|nr:hypothetical protein D922_02417 [Enterococcus faecalis 06-MB-DW-09]
MKDFFKPMKMNLQFWLIQSLIPLVMSKINLLKLKLKLSKK